MTDDTMDRDEPEIESVRSQLQEFCAQAKAAEGNSLLEVIKQVLEAPKIYVFAEFLELPNIQSLKNGPNERYYNTLHLFAYGTYKQYKQTLPDYLDLSPVMLKKLQHLTIVTLAIKEKTIPYELLLKELEIDNVRCLEDVIIEAIYADIIHGKLFQNHRFLEVDYAQGRDIPPGYTSKIAATLEEWVSSCDTISNCMAAQIKRANDEKAKRFKNKERIEKEIVNLKKALKTQMAEGDDTNMQVDPRDLNQHNHETRRKSLRKSTRQPGGLMNIESSDGDPRHDNKRERESEKMYEVGSLFKYTFDDV